MNLIFCYQTTEKKKKYLIYEKIKKSVGKMERNKIKITSFDFQIQIQKECQISDKNLKTGTFNAVLF